MRLMDEVNNIDAQIKAENGPRTNNLTADEQEVKKDENVENRAMPAPSMTREQADAVMNIAKNPKDFIGVKVSTAINELIEKDDNVKDQISSVAEDTTMAGIETFSTTNKKQRKANYYELNEKDIAPMGGDQTSSKGQQVSIVLLRRFFWVLIMATLGFFYIAPLTVMVELFQGLSFRKVEREETEYEGGDRKNKKKITRTKLGKFGMILGLILGFILDAAVAVGNYFFPIIYLQISLVVFIVLLVTSIACDFNLSRFKKAKNKKEKENDDATTVVVEEE